ncbi:hypothetical protein SPHINGOR109_50870 [Sphingorhabdus sp. 109]|nr:hypothetical protein SPHINGOR109_50870 [Sphingorhabdus sp. 109]
MSQQPARRDVAAELAKKTAGVTRKLQ